MKRKGIVVIVAAGVIVLAAASFFLLKKPGSPTKVEKLRVGLLSNPVSSLLYIAKQQGFFKRRSMDLSTENYQSGADAVKDLLKNKVDVAIAAEFVLATQGFKREDLRAIGSISASDTVEVIARKDRGIEKPKDLKGKIIGCTKGTINDFFLSTFLSSNNIRPEEVRTVDVRHEEIPKAFSEGKVDAALSFSTYLGAIKKSLAGTIHSWPAQGGRHYYYLLIIREDLVKTHPRAISGLLRGVLEAETFVRKHEKEAQDLMKNVLGLDQEGLMRIWLKTRFAVRLDPDLLTLMEDEGRWAIKNKLVDARVIPDYSTFLYLEGLRKIKPEAVGIN